MREIKFRGRDIITKEWLYGSLLIDGLESCIFHTNKFGITGTDKVSNETVGQFTGFKDRNDKEIYEGDIIQIPDDYDIYGMNAGEIYEVIFSHGGFRMKAKHNKNSKGYYLDDNNSDEIIGNKFDNPELLEVNND